MEVAKYLYERALGIYEYHFGPDSTQAGNILYDLCVLLEEMGEFDEAENLLRRELEISIAQSGEDSSGTLTSIDNLIDLLESKGDINGEIEMRQRQLAILKKLTEDEGRIASSMQNLAVALRNAGRLEEAEPLQQESLDIVVRLNGADSLEAASAYSAMGMLLKMKGDLNGAEALLRKALTIRDRELGADAKPTMLVRERLEELLAKENDALG